ncbi:MAG: hypothetical protein ACRD8Z_18670, partial [Nitrososphaeraceae archaeon]
SLRTSSVGTISGSTNGHSTGSDLKLLEIPLVEPENLSAHPVSLAEGSHAGVLPWIRFGEKKIVKTTEKLANKPNPNTKSRVLPHAFMTGIHMSYSLEEGSNFYLSFLVLDGLH